MNFGAAAKLSFFLMEKGTLLTAAGAVKTIAGIVEPILAKKLPTTFTAVWAEAQTMAAAGDLTKAAGALYDLVVDIGPALADKDQQANILSLVPPP